MKSLSVSIFTSSLKEPFIHTVIEQNPCTGNVLEFKGRENESDQVRSSECPGETDLETDDSSAVS